MSSDNEEPRSTAERPAAGLRLPILTLAFLATGALVRVGAGPGEATIVWMVGLIVTGAPRRIATRSGSPPSRCWPAPWPTS
jgi:hypothetical protein